MEARVPADNLHKTLQVLVPLGTFPTGCGDLPSLLLLPRLITVWATGCDSGTAASPSQPSISPSFHPILVHHQK